MKGAEMNLKKTFVAIAVLLIAIGVLFFFLTAAYPKSSNSYLHFALGIAAFVFGLIVYWHTCERNPPALGGRRESQIRDKRL